MAGRIGKLRQIAKLAKQFTARSNSQPSTDGHQRGRPEYLAEGETEKTEPHPGVTFPPLAFPP